MHQHQQNILKKLAQVPSARFNRLKDPNLDPKQFVYHLNQLIKQEYVVKTDNLYSLTRKGKIRLGTYLSPFKQMTQQGLTTLLFIENTSDQMLVVKRQQAPFLGHIGHPTTRVKKNELTRESAERLADDLGISGNPRLACVLDYLYDAPTPEDIYRLVMFVYYLRTDRSPTSQITSQEGETLWMTKQELSDTELGYANTADIIDSVQQYKVSGSPQFLSKRYATVL